MAIKCLHNDHSFPDQQHKFQKIENEQAQGSTAFEGKVTPQETLDLSCRSCLKYDWFCKGDQGEIMTVHLYVKDLTSHSVDVILYEDELQVKFCTSNNEFLKMYSGTSANTLFSWTVLLRENADIQESSCRISKAFLEISLKKKTPGRWSGLEKLNFPGQKGNGVPKDRPFRHLSGGSRLGMMSHSKQTVCNGVHEKFEKSQNLESDHDKEIKATSKANNSEETHPIPEEKIITNGDPVPAQAPESNEYSECTNTERNSFDGHRPDEKVVTMAGEGNRAQDNCDLKLSMDAGSSELRTLKTSGSTNGHLNRENPAEKAPVENDWVDMSSVSQAQKASATSTAESLTTSFSSLSTTVQPSTSTSTLSSVSSFNLNDTPSTEGAIPLPPPIPPPHAHYGNSGSQVKMGVMGGSQSDTTHLPFSEAIRAAASKNVGALSEGFDDVETSQESDQAGLTGLDNLGNTCYLNSIVQCLANTRQLRDFFLDDGYKADINTENPLGTGGKLAVIFANLMRNLWSGRERSLSPYKLKTIVGEKVSQFKGFMQQDAQEFMAFLLDGLHEDLNRIKEKPYVEEVEGAGKPDAEVANEAWRRYKSRNDSVIVDLFQGQLKSKLTCPVCNKISIKYDPFMNLSVPLPKEHKLITVTIFFKDCKRVPLKIVAKVTLEATVEQLTAAVQRVTAIQPENMRVYEVFHGKFHRAFTRGSSLSSIFSTDTIVVYEVLSEEEAGKDVIEVPIIQRVVAPCVAPSYCASCHRRPEYGDTLRRCTQCWGIGYCNQSCQKEHWTVHKKNCKRVLQPLGIPFIVSIAASAATFSRLQYMAKEYAKYSVDVRPGERDQQDSSRNGEASSADGTSPILETPSRRDSEDACAAGSAKDAKETYPNFHIKPVNAYGEGITGPEGSRLSDEGSEPLALAGRYFSIDWRNHPRQSEFVVVEEKDLVCDKHSSVKTEAITESYSCSLKQCLELFTEPETLSENDAWYCPHCKAHREATKQLSVWRLPEILIIHLKRFSFRNLLFKDKITKLVEFPLRGLDMSPYTLGKDDKEGSLYDLFAVANHSGTVNFGHYTAFGRLADRDHPVNGMTRGGLGWRYFDDRSVTETSEERVVSKYAYVLFYKRRHALRSLKTDFKPTYSEGEILEENEERAKASLEDVDENELD